jgi:hypothetical protein
MSNVAIAPPFSSTESYFFYQALSLIPTQNLTDRFMLRAGFESRIPVSQALYVIKETAFSGVLPA